MKQGKAFLKIHANPLRISGSHLPLKIAATLLLTSHPSPAPSPRPAPQELPLVRVWHPRKRRRSHRGCERLNPLSRRLEKQRHRIGTACARVHHRVKKKKRFHRDNVIQFSLLPCESLATKKKRAAATTSTRSHPSSSFPPMLSPFSQSSGVKLSCSSKSARYTAQEGEMKRQQQDVISNFFPFLRSLGLFLPPSAFQSAIS